MYRSAILELLEAFKKHPVRGTIISVAAIGLIAILCYVEHRRGKK